MAKGETKRYPELGIALTDLLTRYKARHKVKRFSQREIGVRVAQSIGRAQPIDDQRVSNWFAGQEPYFLEGIALCEILGANPLDVLREIAAARSTGGAPDLPVLVSPTARVSDEALANASEKQKGRRSRGHPRSSGRGAHG